MNTCRCSTAARLSKRRQGRCPCGPLGPIGSIDPAGNLLYSATSTASNVVQLLAAPGQPTNLSAKVSGATVSVVDGGCGGARFEVDLPAQGEPDVDREGDPTRLP